MTSGSEVRLTEAARTRLLTIAADVVGKLPPDRVPTTLRSVARFTPAKRLRLGATLLSGALDSDEQFRAAVAEVVTEASPQLADAVRDGEPTVASDPVDTAVVAYLVRGDGWEDVVSAANERWSAERHQTGQYAAEAELARLRLENAELRAKAKGEAAGVRAAVASATAQLTEELERTRRQLRIRTGDQRAAQRSQEQAEAALAAAQGRLAAVEATHEAELRRLRGRVAESERAAENARRGSRAERDLDDARLWLLVDTLTEAAAGVRRELSLSAPSVRPADAVAAGSAAPGDRRAADAPALERLFQLPNVHLILDGYNVTKTGFPEMALADQRTRLISAMTALAGRFAIEITIAFDGAQRPPVQPATPRGIRVLFSAVGEIADDLIRRLVAAEPRGRSVVVVSADQLLTRDVRSAGAWTVPSAVLLQVLG